MLICSQQNNILSKYIYWHNYIETLSFSIIGSLRKKLSAKAWPCKHNITRANDPTRLAAVCTTTFGYAESLWLPMELY